MLGVDPTIVVIALFIGSMWAVGKLAERRDRKEKEERNKRGDKYPPFL